MSDALEPLDNREVVRLVVAGHGVGLVALAGLVAVGETKLAVVALLGTMLLGALSVLGTLCAAGGAVAHRVQSGMERRQLVAARIHDRRAGTLSVADTPGALSPLDGASEPRP